MPTPELHKEPSHLQRWNLLHGGNSINTPLLRKNRPNLPRNKPYPETTDPRTNLPLLRYSSTRLLEITQYELYNLKKVTNYVVTILYNYTCIPIQHLRNDQSPLDDTRQSIKQDFLPNDQTQHTKYPNPRRGNNLLG